MVTVSPDVSLLMSLFLFNKLCVLNPMSLKTLMRTLGWLLHSQEQRGSSNDAHLMPLFLVHALDWSWPFLLALQLKEAGHFTNYLFWQPCFTVFYVQQGPWVLQFLVVDGLPGSYFSWFLCICCLESHTLGKVTVFWSFITPEISWFGPCKGTIG